MEIRHCNCRCRGGTQRLLAGADCCQWHRTCRARVKQYRFQRPCWYCTGSWYVYWNHFYCLSLQLQWTRHLSDGSAQMQITRNAVPRDTTTDSLKFDQHVRGQFTDGPKTPSTGFVEWTQSTLLITKQKLDVQHATVGHCLQYLAVCPTKQAAGEPTSCWNAINKTSEEKLVPKDKRTVTVVQIDHPPDEHPSEVMLSYSSVESHTPESSVKLLETTVDLRRKSGA